MKTVTTSKIGFGQRPRYLERNPLLLEQRTWKAGAWRLQLNEKTLFSRLFCGEGKIDSSADSPNFSECRTFSDNPQNPSVDCRELTFLVFQWRIEKLQKRPVQVSPL